MAQLPYLYRLETQLQLVSDSLPGAYLLSQNGKKVQILGSAGENLRHVIGEAAAANGGSVYFSYEYANSAVDAYGRACRWYHLYAADGKLAHPEPPAESGWKCYWPSCPRSK